ncbi:luxQ, partial [Symbiodinium microadriaticum]
DWLKDKAAPSPRGEAPTPAVPAESTSSATRRATDSEEIQALKEELARYRSKQQYVRERLAMQLRLDAALQSQDWKTVNQVPTMSRAASGEPT